jgi:SAM-dependent methyltransferase
MAQCGKQSPRIKPMEHFYSHINGWSHYLIPLYTHLVPKLPAACTVVEVGCWKGRSTAFLAVSLIQHGKVFKLHAVDHWKGCLEGYYQHSQVAQEIRDDKVFDDFKRNLAPVAEHMNIIRSNSVDAAAQFEDNSLDMVTIDDDHLYESVINSIMAWAPKLKPGGFLCGDDCDKYYPGVARAVKEAFGEDWVLLDLDGKIAPLTDAGSWIWTKPENWMPPIIHEMPADPWAPKVPEPEPVAEPKPEPVAEPEPEPPAEPAIPVSTLQNDRQHVIV